MVVVWLGLLRTNVNGTSRQLSRQSQLDDEVEDKGLVQRD
jgi:hypothetical protein